MKKINSKNTYLVGGAVRDILLGENPKDKDYVVIGLNPSDMIEMGFSQVGKDFPVFLHPETGFEYALARKEIKNGFGYNGFSVDTKGVSLEDDLFRRDLTINAMAMDELGNLIDPFNGKEDLQNKILKHVSEHFKEDPVRILRTARFSARYDFSVHEETISLMQSIVSNGEFNHLTSERVWKEFEKVLTEKKVYNFFKVLKKSNALEKLSGFSNNINLDYLEHLESHNIHNINKKLIACFKHMNEKDLNLWKMPTEEKTYILNFKQFSKNNNFYSNMNVEEKLFFINKTKSIHDLNKNKELINNIIDYLSWKEKKVYDFESEFNLLTEDVCKIKSLDYQNIINQAKELGEKPQVLIIQNQKNAILPKKGLKLK